LIQIIDRLEFVHCSIDIDISQSLSMALFWREEGLRQQEGRKTARSFLTRKIVTPHHDLGIRPSSSGGISGFRIRARDPQPENIRKRSTVLNLVGAGASAGFLLLFLQDAPPENPAHRILEA
jgi:hypothetical protein